MYRIKKKNSKLTRIREQNTTFVKDVNVTTTTTTHSENTAEMYYKIRINFPFIFFTKFRTVFRAANADKCSCDLRSLLCSLCAVYKYLRV